MKFGIRHPALMLFAAFLWPSALAFTPAVVPRISSSLRHGATVVRAYALHQSASPAPEKVGVAPDVVVTAGRPQVARPAGSIERALRGAALGAATGFFATMSGALAEYVDPDDVGEIVSSELPPMWVPLAIGAGLTVGIGLLQVSLGDVMNDEAKLGALSGARAAKQSARDRDMFKKKDPK